MNNGACQRKPRGAPEDSDPVTLEDLLENYGLTSQDIRVTPKKKCALKKLLKSITPPVDKKRLPRSPESLITPRQLFGPESSAYTQPGPMMPKPNMPPTPPMRDMTPPEYISMPGNDMCSGMGFQSATDIMTPQLHNMTYSGMTSLTVPLTDALIRMGNTSGPGDKSGMGNMTGMSNMSGMGNMSGPGDMCDMGNMSGMGNMTGMSNMSGMGNMSGPGDMCDMGNMSGMGNMTGMSNMSGMGNMSGPGDMCDMGNMSGMGNMTGMGNMSGMGTMSGMGNMSAYNVGDVSSVQKCCPCPNSQSYQGCM
ncbi:uncharacterized protein LOC109600068 [Aethina tumida]|uniref:uncharacterized protein LOC109600068 n=1 Tax=Aethina tumida TaxID=116153 RepID=UPI0021481171|nr:uncharacterized protein LOC109600068 [Aethina tumida]